MAIYVFVLVILGFLATMAFLIMLPILWSKLDKIIELLKDKKK